MSIAAAGACRAAAYTANPYHPIICLEPHSYSAFSHKLLDALFSPTVDGANLTKFAPQNGGTGTEVLLKYLRNTHDNESYRDFVRPLVSVLDVSTPDEPDKYSTVNQSEMNAFVDPFIQAIDEASNSLPINLNDWEKSRPDVYGAVNSILERLDAVIKKADDYIGADDCSIVVQTINTVTIEYNRVLVTSEETSNIQANKKEFHQRCQVVGMAFVAGLNKMQNLIQQRIQKERLC